MKGNLIKLTMLILLAIGIHKIAPSVFYVVTNAETIEIGCRETGQAFLTNLQNVTVDYCSYGQTAGIQTLGTYNVNQQFNYNSNLTYARWPLKFNTTVSNGYYDIAGQFSLVGAGRFVSNITWVTTNQICNIISIPEQVGGFVSFECKNVQISNNYFNLQINFKDITVSGTFYPNITRYLTLTQTTNDIMKEDHTYNNTPSTDVPGNDEIDDLTDAEDELFDNIDLSGVEDLNISINPNANNFIWEIVNQLRQMNSNIILLITSALGLGIIKMILNR